MEQQKDLLQDELISALRQRRKLLPWWIKIFIWIFLLLGAIVPFALAFAIMGYRFQISLYGLETNEPFSLTGVSLMIIFLIKGIAAYGLWTEKNWAVTLSIIDAILGLAICVLVMIYPLIAPQRNYILNFRLEVLLLTPYLLLLLKIKDAWNSSIYTKP
jgi:hypothetical protein